MVVTAMPVRRKMGRRAMLGGTALMAFAAPAILSSPLRAAGTGFDAARHLLSRTGFGPKPSEIAAFEQLEHDAAVDRLLRAWKTEAVTPAPSWIGMSPPQAREAQRTFQEKRAARAAAGNPPGASPGADAGAPPPRPGTMPNKPLENANPLQEQGRELRNWWIEEMLVTDQPLVERMALFWHNHFTSGLQKVRFAPAMYRQNALFRRHALGNFATLLREIARDPAMLRYLDGAQNRASQPNENFARELLELFTLGEGHYSEADIKAAARAFSGWGLDPETGAFRFYPGAHDTGAKTFLGRTGNLDGGDILDVLLARPRTAEFLVAKLWREFVSLKPNDGEIKRLAGVLRGANYEMRPLLKAMFSSETFGDSANRGSLIKSPVELVIGTVRLLGLPVPEKTRLARAIQAMGQIPFEPPNVKGWLGGEAWITTNTLLMRQQILRRIVEATSVASADDGPEGGMTPPGMMPKPGRRSDRREQMEPDPRPVEGRSLRGAGMSARLGPSLSGVDVPTLTRALLPLPPLSPLPADAGPGEAVATLLLDPVYQLK